MPIDWSDQIVLAQLPEEPELSEEFTSIFSRIESSDHDPGSTPDFVLNFAQVSYLNSSHLAALLRLRKLLHTRGRSLVLCGLSEQLHSVIGLTGIVNLFTITDDPATALAALQLSGEGEPEPEV